MRDKFIGYGVIAGLILALIVTFLYILTPNSSYVHFVFEKLLLNSDFYPDTRLGSIFSFILMILPVYGIFIGGLLGFFTFLVISYLKKINDVP
jgi:hypothetical protein